jgi:hypothetical protein
MISMTSAAVGQYECGVGSRWKPRSGTPNVAHVDELRGDDVHYGSACGATGPA